MTTWSILFWRIVLLGGSDSGKSNFGASPNLSGIMQAVSCIMSTTHGLGTTVGKGLTCLCQICAQFLLTFYFFTNYWQAGPPANFFIKFSPLEWNAISSNYIQAILH